MKLYLNNSIWNLLWAARLGLGVSPSTPSGGGGGGGGGKASLGASRCERRL